MAQWWTLMVFFKLENLIFLHNQFLKPNLAHPFLRKTSYEEFGFFPPIVILKEIPIVCPPYFCLSWVLVM